MQEVVLVIHLMLAVALVITGIITTNPKVAPSVLVVVDKGSMMTGRSAANLLTRLTSILAACFFTTSLVLAWMAKQDSVTTSVLDNPAPISAPMTAPVEEEKIPQVPVSN